MSDIFLKNKKNNKNISDFLQTETVSTLNLPEWVSLVDIPNKDEKTIESETSTADLEMKLRNIFKNTQNGGGENVELVLNGKKKSQHNLMSVTKKVSKKLVGGKKTSKKVSKKLTGGSSCHTKKSSKKKMSKKVSKKSSKKKTSKKVKRSKKASKKSSKKVSKKSSKKKASKKAKRSKKSSKKSSKKASKKSSKKASKKAKRSKKSSKKSSKKASKKSSKKKSSKKVKRSKKASKKSSKKKTSKKAKRAVLPHITLMQDLLKIIKEKEGINHPQAMKKMGDYIKKALGKSWEEAKAEGMSYVDALKKTIEKN